MAPCPFRGRHPGVGFPAHSARSDRQRPDARLHRCAHRPRARLEPHLFAGTAAPALRTASTADAVRRRRALPVAATHGVADRPADRPRCRRGVLRLDGHIARGSGGGLVAGGPRRRLDPPALPARRAGLVPGAVQPEPGPAGDDRPSRRRRLLEAGRCRQAIPCRRRTGSFGGEAAALARAAGSAPGCRSLEDRRRVGDGRRDPCRPLRPRQRTARHRGLPQPDDRGSDGDQQSLLHSGVRPGAGRAQLRGCDSRRRSWSGGRVPQPRSRIVSTVRAGAGNHRAERHLLAPAGFHDPRDGSLAFLARHAVRLAAHVVAGGGVGRRAGVAGQPAADPHRCRRLVGVPGRAFTNQARSSFSVVNASQVRIPHARVFVVIMALIGAATILWASRSFTFYYDEWTFILTSPDWTLATYLQPHNVHPAMLPRLIYAAMLATVGLRTYLPYMAIVLVLHATSVVLLFELVRRRAGDLFGLACAAILLVLGAGWENLLWAFQMGFVGSVACGLGMLIMLEGATTPRRMPIVTALLTGSLMFSAVGLFFGVAAFVRLAATSDRRKDLVWLVPVGVLFAAWFLVYGRFGSQPNPPPSPANVLVLPQYMLWGLGESAAGLIGEGGLFGPAVLVLAAGAVGFSWWKGGLDPLALGVAAALVIFYAVTGLSRDQLGYQQSAARRAVSEGGVSSVL